MCEVHKCSVKQTDLKVAKAYAKVTLIVLAVAKVRDCYTVRPYFGRSEVRRWAQKILDRLTII